MAKSVNRLKNISGPKGRNIIVFLLVVFVARKFIFGTGEATLDFEEFWTTFWDIIAYSWATLLIGLVVWEVLSHSAHYSPSVDK